MDKVGISSLLVPEPDVVEQCGRPVPQDRSLDSLLVSQAKSLSYIFSLI